MKKENKKISRLRQELQILKIRVRVLEALQPKPATYEGCLKELKWYFLPVEGSMKDRLADIREGVNVTNN